MSNPCGDNIFFDEGKWEFNEQVSLMFPVHARKSIPGYLDVHTMVADIIHMSSLKKDSLRIVDLGCSTGELEGRVSCLLPLDYDFKMFGVDSSGSMITCSRYNVRHKNIDFICDDIMDYLNVLHSHRASFDIITCLYTLQFLKEEDQYKAMQMISEVLSPGGMFILADKFRAENIDIDAIKESNLIVYKIKQGFTPEEITGKQLALKGVQNRIPYPIEFLSKYFERAEILDSSLNFICSIFYKR